MNEWLEIFLFDNFSELNHGTMVLNGFNWLLMSLTLRGMNGIARRAIRNSQEKQTLERSQKLN
jgi:hypothetical protein